MNAMQLPEGALEEAQQNLEKAEKSKVIMLPPIVRGLDFMDSILDLPDELIEGILHKGTKMTLTGGSKSFKSWMLLHMAYCIANGVDWLGHKTIQGSVLYINLEIRKEFLQQRMRSLEAALSTDDKRVTAEYIDVWNLRGHSEDAITLVPRLVRRIKETKEDYAMAILDPFYKLSGGRDENKAGDITDILNAFERMSVDTGASVAYAHHHTKGEQLGKAVLDRGSGSGVFARDPDTLIDVVSPNEAKPDEFQIQITVRNMKPVPIFGARWKHPLMVADNRIEVGRKGPKKVFSDLDLCKPVIGDQNKKTPGDWLHALDAKGVIISESQFRARRKQMPFLMEDGGEFYVPEDYMFKVQNAACGQLQAVNDVLNGQRDE